MNRGTVATVLVFMGIGLIVGGSIVLGTQTVVDDGITCGSAITADDKTLAVNPDTNVGVDTNIGPTCAIVRSTRSTGGTIALALGISLLLAAGIVALTGPRRPKPIPAPPGPFLPSHQGPYPGPPPGTP